MTTDSIRPSRFSRIAGLAVLLTTAAGAAAESPDPTAPLLKLDDAIEMAVSQNHLLDGAARAVDAAKDRAAALRTRRLPAVALSAFELRWTDSLDLTIPAGSLGNVPPIGPFPTQDATLSIPADNGGLAMVSVSQPITQQYKIGLGVKLADLDRGIAEEDLRRERQRVIAEVRTTYYRISATEQGIVALRDLVRAVEELDAVTTRYLDEGLVLRSDALEVRARLARERQRLAAAESGLETQKEHLNQLLGREISTPYRVTTPPELAPRAAGLSLQEARDLAAASRPEIRSASLLVSQAETARRLAVSGWIPDLTLSASYARPFDFAALPDHVTTVGLYLGWEPFDWGRKRREASERAHQAAAARSGHREAEEEIAVEVGQRWRAVKDAAALLDATRLEQDATAASLDTDRNRYRENAAILRDVLRTEARLSAARNDFTDALAGYWSAIAELERTISDEN